MIAVESDYHRIQHAEDAEMGKIILVGILIVYIFISQYCLREMSQPPPLGAPAFMLLVIVSGAMFLVVPWVDHRVATIYSQEVVQPTRTTWIFLTAACIIILSVLVAIIRRIAKGAKEIAQLCNRRDT